MYQEHGRNVFEHLPGIPSNDYGYWVSPTGEFHVATPSEKHVGVASRLLGRPPGGEGRHNDDHRIDLYKQGWTRIAMHSGCFVVQLPPMEVTSAVIEKVHTLVWHVHKQGHLPIQVEDGLTGEVAGGRTVRPGDPSVCHAWIQVAAARGVPLNNNGTRPADL